MGSNREIKSDGEINITSTQTNVSGDLTVSGTITGAGISGGGGTDTVASAAEALAYAGTSRIIYITATEAVTFTADLDSRIIISKEEYELTFADNNVTNCIIQAADVVNFETNSTDGVTTLDIKYNKIQNYGNVRIHDKGDTVGNTIEFDYNVIDSGGFYIYSNNTNEIEIDNCNINCAIFQANQYTGAGYDSSKYAASLSNTQVTTNIFSGTFKTRRAFINAELGSTYPTFASSQYTILRVQNYDYHNSSYVTIIDEDVVYFPFKIITDGLFFTDKKDEYIKSRNHRMYSTYADAAATTPADGTGGAANVTLTTNITTPLRDGSDLKFAKDAANRQGEGVGYDFTIDNADKAKKLIISFDYDASHASYADDDIKIFIYDVTNTTLIRVNGEELKGGKGKHYAQFQSASNSTSYRLIFHVSSTNASAYDVYLKDVSVKPQGLSDVSVLSRDIKVIGSGSSGSEVTADTERIDWTVTTDSSGSFSTTDNGPDTFTCPESGTYAIDGVVSLTLGSASDQSVVAYVNNSAHIYIHIAPTSTTTRYKKINGMVSLEKGDTLDFRLTSVGTISNNSLHWLHIQKVGSSQVAVSNASDVVFIGTTNAAPTVATATYTTIDFVNVERDSHGAYSGGTFTVPESGTYKINSNLLFESTAALDQDEVLFTDIRVGGVSKRRGNYKEIIVTNSQSVTYATTANAALELNKGDQVSIVAYQNSGGSLDIYASDIHNFCDITKIASPQPVLENETVAFIADTNAGQTIANNTITIIDFEDVEHDSHNAYDSGTYTVPVTGLYQINSSIMFGHTSEVDISEAMYIALKVNGGSKRIQNWKEGELTDSATLYYSLQISCLLKLNKGDEITIQVYQATGVPYDLHNSNAYNSLDIHKIK